MTVHFYIEIINAALSLFNLISLVYIIWFMIKKPDIIRAIMFLKGDKFKNPTIIISFGLLLIVARESYKATSLLGNQISENLVELLEFGSILTIFFGVILVNRLFWRSDVISR
ncbi:MAG: hypothetical protein FIB07_05155 [Candidatus Methanoperedens sp.]|nr:hypothetical protein [Candidatus Methanoperedens sp.]